MEYILRKATAEDAGRINDLFIEMLQTIFEDENVEGYKPGDLDYYFSGNEDWICVAETEGRIIGFLSIEVHREVDNFLYYDDFSVSKNYRGMGVGTALMEEAEKYCKSLGFDSIVLHVEKDNADAQRLYERKGFALLRDDGRRLCLIKHVERG